MRHRQRAFSPVRQSADERAAVPPSVARFARLLRAHRLPAPVRRAGGKALAAVYGREPLRAEPPSAPATAPLTMQEVRLVAESRSVLGSITLAPITDQLLIKLRDGLNELDAGGPRG
ncbi:hypothetical protein SAMN05421505_12070 [Sinosporangium album]|uniref:Uncharacterized protein n=1 Tax=Sinosporangium album TaxID=504805 RepID=A0A1G8EET2_9ACTN|nr:hypothetical protein SAMN05421505_12070 [Sinosporangium album]